MAHILLVDDDGFTRKMIGHLLTNNCHSVIEAKNGIEGMEKLSSKMPDIIITDIIMAEKEGVGLHSGYQKSIQKCAYYCDLGGRIVQHYKLFTDC